jgi:hypothetical protein
MSAPRWASSLALGLCRICPRKHTATDPSDQPYDKCVADQNECRVWGVWLIIEYYQQEVRKNNNCGYDRPQPIQNPSYMRQHSLYYRER